MVLYNQDKGKEKERGKKKKMLNYNEEIRKLEKEIEKIQSKIRELKIERRFAKGQILFELRHALNSLNSEDELFQNRGKEDLKDLEPILIEATSKVF